jgi:hypothetical protein
MNSLKGVLVGGLTGVAVGLGGFVIAEIPATHAMGPVIFMLVPFAAGFAITIGVALGFVYHALRAKLTGKAGPTFASLVLLSMPLLILTGHRIELSTLTHPRQEIVTTTIRLATDPSHVWNDLRAFDSLQGKKPLLMYIGLPVPMRCEMQGTGLGAKRTCYFDHGSIEETVIGWQPPNVMRLSIDRTNMPGRHWLGFEYAEYTLQQDGDGTILTRNTTIISNLYPAWYWRPIERWGVSSEHGYIFSDLARRAPH